VLKAYRNGDEEKLALYLGLKPWQASPLDMETSDEPCTHPPETEYAKSWPNAQELRRQLKPPVKSNRNLAIVPVWCLSSPRSPNLHPALVARPKQPTKVTANFLRFNRLRWAYFNPPLYAPASAPNLRLS
jgi:hypothetical protein